MTSAFSILRSRVDRMESRPTMGPGDVNDPARRNDGAIRRAVQRAGEHTVTVRYPGVVAAGVVQTYYSHAWSASYPAGGETTVPALSTLVPGFRAAVIPPVNGYSFVYSGGKILAYTAAGTEVVATTDLSAAVGTSSILVMGTAQTTMDGWRCASSGTIAAASLRVSSAVTASATNYWTIQMRVKAAGDSYGRTIGRTISTSVVGVPAGTDVVLLDPEADGAVVLDPDDLVVLYAVPSTGATAPLGDVTMTLEIQRQVL